MLTSYNAYKPYFRHNHLSLNVLQNEIKKYNYFKLNFYTLI